MILPIFFRERSPEEERSRRKADEFEDGLKRKMIEAGFKKKGPLESIAGWIDERKEENEGIKNINNSTDWREISHLIEGYSDPDTNIGNATTMAYVTLKVYIDNFKSNKITENDFDAGLTDILKDHGDMRVIKAAVKKIQELRELEKVESELGMK